VLKLTGTIAAETELYPDGTDHSRGGTMEEI